VEWVEVTAKTIEEAKDAALDQLGVDEADAEFEVIEPPKGGLFGRLRSEARVRARVLPTAPRPKVDRRERRRQGSGRDRGTATGTGGGGGGGGRRPPESRRSSSQESSTSGAARTARPQPDQGAEMTSDAPAVDGAEVAETFVRGLLDTFGSSYEVTRQQVDDDTVEIAVEGEDLGLLIGQRGQTLSAVQELARTVVQRRAVGYQGRVVVDVSGYRRHRREALERFTRNVAEQVLESGVARVLEPMPPADRKVVHDTVNTLDGVVTSSEGEEPRRRVVISPEDASD
jgi:spoIIIJ-associated protein